MTLGWTSEQSAGVKSWWRFATFFAALGVILAIFLIAQGNTGAWGLLALLVVVWGGGAYTLRVMRRGQP